MRNSVSEGLCGRQVMEVRLQLPAGLAAGGAAGSLAVVVVVRGVGSAARSKDFGAREPRVETTSGLSP